jgi:hypothetical protein
MKVKYQRPPKGIVRQKIPEYITIKLWDDLADRIRTTAPSGRNKLVGKTTSLRFYSFISFLFDINEHLPKEKKMTDYAIARNIVEEFPKYTKVKELLRSRSRRHHPRHRMYYSVEEFRSRYNRGLLINRPVNAEYHLAVQRGPVSFRYNSDGERVAVYNPDRKLNETDTVAFAKRYAKHHYAFPPIEFFVGAVDPDSVKSI